MKIFSGCYNISLTFRRINPVTGCIQEQTPNPLEGMSEEQKEYEANQLVNLIDQMQR